MGQSIFKGWIADNDPRYSNNTISVCVGTSFSLAGRPQTDDKADETKADETQVSKIHSTGVATTVPTRVESAIEAKVDGKAFPKEETETDSAGA